MLWWWLIWLITFNLITTLAWILYQHFPFQVCQECGKSLSKCYKIFLESVFGLREGSDSSEGTLGPQKVVPNIRFGFFGFVFCHVAIWQMKSIKKSTGGKKKKRLDFQQDLLLVSLSFMQIFTCGKCRDRSCDISPRCAFSNQVTVGGLKTAHFLFSQQWTSVWAL